MAIRTVVVELNEFHTALFFLVPDAKQGSNFVLEIEDPSLLSMTLDFPLNFSTSAKLLVGS